MTNSKSITGPAEIRRLIRASDDAFMRKLHGYKTRRKGFPESTPQIKSNQVSRLQLEKAIADRDAAYEVLLKRSFEKAPVSDKKARKA